MVEILSGPGALLLGSFVMTLWMERGDRLVRVWVEWEFSVE